MDDILGLDTYVIGRPIHFAINVAYDCYDSGGTKLIDVKPRLLGGYTLKDNTGKEVGEIHQKMVSLAPTYELYDGSKKLLGSMSELITVSLTGAKKFELKDASGNKIAHLEITSPLMSIVQIVEGKQAGAVTGYDVVGADGTTPIAKIGMQSSATGWIGRNMANFVLQIIDKSVPTLLLIEFAVAVDHLYMYSSMNTRTFGMGGGMGMGGPGMGGFGGGRPGGFSIGIK